MKPYSSYKNSGVEWIGEIPSEWKVKKLKYVSSLITEKKDTKNDDIKISPENVESHTGRCFNLYSDYNSQGVPFKSGDILLNKLRLYLVKILLPDYDGFSMGEMIVIRTNDDVYNKYYYFLLFNQGLIDLLDSQSTGIKVPRVSPEIIIDSILPFPSNKEQNQIVDYLDHKTQQIDDLIEKTQTKIELLKEKRTSLINHSVTKGLNPNVDMKNSGIEWIGEVPSHWEITKVKYETTHIVDGTHFTPTYVDSGIPFLRVTDIQDEVIDLNTIKYISEEEHLELIKRCNPQKGDLLLSKNGTIGITKVVDWDWEFSIFVSLCLIRFRETFSKYLFSYFFQSDIVDQQLVESSKQSTVTNLHLDKIRELLLIKPPLLEQQQIVDYLDEHTKKIESTIEKETQRIELLKEYRQSLISEVVTGKIDVREWKQ